MADDNQKKDIQLKLESTMEAGIYSNAVSVHMNKNEMIIDFGYVLPNMKPTTVKVMSRVNMSHETAENMLKIVSNAVLDMKNKKKD